MRFVSVLCLIAVLLSTVSCDSSEPRRIARWFEHVLHLPAGMLQSEQNNVDAVFVQELPRTTEADILAEIIRSKQNDQPLKFPRNHGVFVSGGDDYPECGETVEKTAQHLIESLLDYFYNKVCKDCKNEYVQKVCEYAEKHQEAFQGWIVGYTDPYTKSFFYAAGAGKCDIHGHPFNITGNSGMMSYNDIFSNIDDIYSRDEVGCSGDDDDSDIGMVVQSLYQPDKPDDKCEKCYIGVVKKYIEKVEELENKFCAKTQCPYVQKLCAYLHEHEEFNKGLIAGIFKPFKFAAGFCIGNKDCKHDHSSVDYTAMTVANYFAQHY